MRAVLIAAILVSITLAGCVERHTFERCRGDAVDWKARTMCHDGRMREFLWAAPDGEGPHALLIALHGGAGDADNMVRKTRLLEHADEGVVVIVPDGAPAAKGTEFRTWNAAHCCGRARTDGTDDVAFLDALAEAARERFWVDEARIGVTGHSNGGMMAHHWAASSTVPTHVMPVAGAIGGRTPSDGPWEQSPEPQHAPGVLIIHATDDDRVPYDGGEGENLGTQRWDASVDQAVAFWEAAGSNVTVVMAEGGHGWPGGEADIAQAPAEPDASRLIIDFLLA